jgi:hypothetical protein
MAMAKRKAAKKAAKKAAAQTKAVEAVEAAKPYVQRLVEDDDLRSDLRNAYESARDAYDRAVDGKKPSKVLEDKKLQEDLRSAAESLRSAAEVMREPEKTEKSGGGLGKLLLVAFVAAVLAIVLSEDIRKTLLDKLFGAEEEFEYTSTTTPTAPPATPTG